MNVGNSRHKNTVSGLVLCCNDRGMLAKSADIWLSGRHVANMSATFSAKMLCPHAASVHLLDAKKSVGMISFAGAGGGGMT